jgi:uncharacterized protein
MSLGVVRRSDLVLSRAETETALRLGRVAHFGTVGPDGDPYVIPNLFVYADGRVFLHTASTGHFRRNVEARPRVCFETSEFAQTFAYGEFQCDTSASYVSVIGVGAIVIESDDVEKARFFDRFMQKYGDPAWDRPKSFYPRLGEVTVYCIDASQITGKRVQLPPVEQRWPADNRTKSPGAAPPRQG